MEQNNWRIRSTCSHADTPFTFCQCLYQVICTFSAMSALPLFSKKQETESSTWKIAIRGREGREFSQWQAQQQNQQRKHSIKCGASRIWWFCANLKKDDCSVQMNKMEFPKQVSNRTEHLQEVWCDVECERLTAALGFCETVSHYWNHFFRK